MLDADNPVRPAISRWLWPDARSLSIWLFDMKRGSRGRDTILSLT